MANLKLGCAVKRRLRRPLALPRLRSGDAATAGRLPTLADYVLVLQPLGNSTRVTEQILPVVREQLRIAEGRNPQPSARLTDSSR